ncbi:hypothetical protein A2U01_0089058, partial [Trifolium medium]|nr:hypothetical protein [Trifolium medium]
MGKSDLIPPVDDNPGVGASIKATIDCVADSLKGCVPETNVVPNVDTSMTPNT